MRGLLSEGKTLLNRINAVAPGNPKASVYRGAWSKFLGRLR